MTRCSTAVDLSLCRACAVAAMGQLQPKPTGVGVPNTGEP